MIHLLDAHQQLGCSRSPPTIAITQSVPVPINHLDRQQAAPLLGGECMGELRTLDTVLAVDR